MKIYPAILFVMLMFCSCEQGNSSFKRLVKDTTAQRHPVKGITWAQEVKEAEEDHEIYGAFEPSKNTIVLLRRSLGIELSTDHGKTWQWLAKELYKLDEITVDDKGIWWGLQRWKGIHEASYCRIYKSADCGKTWDGYVFSTEVFFPYHIYSKPSQPFAVSTFQDKKVYSLSGNDPQHHWQYVKRLPQEDEMADISADNYFIDSHLNDDNKLYVKRKNGLADTLLDFKKAYNIYNIKRINNIIYVAGPSTEDKDSYFAVIKNERLFKEFKIPGLDLNITTTQFNHVFLTATSGAYLFKNNNIIQIFK